MRHLTEQSKGVEVWAVIHRKNGLYLESFRGVHIDEEFGALFSEKFTDAHLFLFKHSAEVLVKLLEQHGYSTTALRVYVDPEVVHPKDNHESVLLKIWKRIMGRTRK